MNSEPTRCRLCASSVVACGEQRILRYDVTVFLCPECDLLQTQKPHWLDEAYSTALTLLDTGAAQRSQITVGVTLGIASILGIRRSSRCLDFGGGHGLFVRMMRDRGYDFRWVDRYAENMFARGFTGNPAASHDLVTSFEVFEHLVDVAGDLDLLFRPRHRYILVGTLLHHGYDERWWYFSNETGQHVSFFSPRTMRFVADRYRYQVFIGPQYSLFARDDEAIGLVRKGLLRQCIPRSWLLFGLTSLVPEALRFRFGPSRAADDSSELEQILRQQHIDQHESGRGTPDDGRSAMHS